MDITYLPIRNKMVYLAICIDLCSREVVAYHLSLSQDSSLSIDLILHLSRKRSLAHAIIHTDQGVHYTNHAYIDLLKEKSRLE